jgi:hypothetical protein
LLPFSWALGRRNRRDGTFVVLEKGCLFNSEKSGVKIGPGALIITMAVLALSISARALVATGKQS